MAGAINLALFDKTGTLTEDKFDFVGVLENDSQDNRFQELRKTNFRLGLKRNVFGDNSDLLTDDQNMSPT